MNGTEHAEYVASLAKTKIYNKYLVGQKLHGGFLDRKATAGMALEEALDQVVYLITHLDHLKEIEELAMEIAYQSQEGSIVDQRYQIVNKCAGSIINILRIGNPEGVKEEDK